MHFTLPLSIFSVLFTLTTAIPATSPNTRGLNARGEPCVLPEPASSCTGAKRMDMIVTFEKDTPEATRALVRDAVKSSGGNWKHDYYIGWDFGFSADIPEGVVKLLQAQQGAMKINVEKNACVMIDD